MANAPPTKTPVRVTILGQQFTLMAAGDPREVEALARGVDDLMSSVAARSPNADSFRVAVMACLNLADRTRTLESELTGLKERVGNRTDRLASLLEQAIEPDKGL
ncbi:MAG: cell division protein ZapA [Bryobacterales bacterium]|nr:cell division protein ZapA [Bryobacterales bacterium]